MSSPKSNDHLNIIQPYKGGKRSVPGVEKVYKLSSNENPFGASNSAMKVFKESCEDLAFYPDSSNSDLVKALGDYYNLEENRIICGCGSDEILHLLARIYLDKGDEAIVFENAFAVYPLAIQSTGATVVRAREKNFKPEIDAILSSVTDNTKAIFIANPNNPTGSMLTIDEITDLHSKIPTNILMVVDAAYAEYVRDQNYDVGFGLAKKNENIVITRTFSKVYGLAGLRVGWAYCPKEIKDILYRIKVPFSVNVAAQKTAIQALKDQDHINFSTKHNSLWLPKLSESLSHLGFVVLPSECNFILMQCPESLGFSANQIYELLSSKGLILRQMDEYGLPDFLRLTIGSEEANNLVLSLLEDLIN